MGSTLRSHCLLKHIIEWKKWRKDEYEGVISYWITLMKREDSGNWKMKHQIALSGELVLEEPVDLSWGRLQDK
jgi:hypothetical protein